MIMSRTLQIILFVVMLLYFFVLIQLLKRKCINLKYSLLWLLSGILMLILVIFPRLLDIFSAALGVYEPMNALFAIIIFCLILLVISLTVIVSGQNDKNKRLVQEMGILEQRVRNLEEKQADEEVDKKLGGFL